MSPREGDDPVADDEGSGDTGPDAEAADGISDNAELPAVATNSSDEELIESAAPSARVTEIRRRFALLVPAAVGRKFVVGVAVAALILGLGAGFLIGNVSGDQRTGQTEVQEGPPPDGGYIPIIPEGSLQAEQRVIVLSTAAGSLTQEDLEGLGEAVLPQASALVPTSGLDGVCGIVSTPEIVPLPQGPGVGYGVLGSVAFRLVEATLRQRIGPDLDVLAASTLRGTVELAQSCPSSAGLTVRTDGVQTGTGDEYAVFLVSRTDPALGQIETSIVVLVRVGGQLVELTLSPEGGAEVPDGLARALRIADAAVTSLLAG